MSNFFFCYHVLKKLSAVEASESIYMRERVKEVSTSNKNKIYFDEKKLISFDETVGHRLNNVFNGEVSGDTGFSCIHKQ